MILKQDIDTIETSFINDNDEILVQECLAGNEDAWAHLFHHYSRLIYKIPLSFGFPHLEAEEIFQETAIEIVNCLSTLHSPSHLRSWIVTIARRVCIRRFRSAKRYSTVDIALIESINGDDVDTLEAMLIRLEEYSLLRRALSALEPKCYTLLSELFLKEPSLSHAEIAAMLNVPLGSIGPTRARCLEKLRKQVERITRADAVKTFEHKYL